MREAVRGKGFGTPYGRGVLRATVLLVLLVCLLMLLTMWGCSSPGPDTTPPAAVSDLAVAGTRDSSLTVTWTAPGDDGDRGRAASYDLRYAPAPLPAGWDSATAVDGLAPPRAAGLAETVRVGGLEPHQTYWLALQAADEAGNVSALSNVAQGETGDSTPPGRVTDLRAESLEPHAVVLAFTAPGDDGQEGQAAAYEVRYASVPVTESSWEQATAFEVTQAPQPAGATETIRVEGLTPETTVHLALRAVDDAALAGPVSNEVEVTLPADEVPPGAITDLQVTGTGIFTATLGWTAPGNDGEHGKAEGYEVRYAEEAITEGTWEEATAVPVSLVPKEAGEEEELTLTDLPGDRVLWFAVRATDEAGNEGAVSNGASGFVRREPRTWEIRADGSGDVATVQAGIDTASPGDEVVVYPGTYREHIDFRGKGIYLHSAEGPEGTILDGSATEGSVVIFQSGETREATLEGFTVTGGTGTVVGEGALVVGGGIYCSDSSPTIVRNHIVDNKAGFPLRGGGGGMLIDGSRDTRPFISPIVEDNVFERNRAATNGGGLVIGSADVTIARNTFLGNESIYDGGAVFVMMGEPGTARFIENEFWENVAGDHGGAIEAGQMGYGSAPLQIEGNLFVRNEAHGEDLPSDSGTGGGISMRGWAGSIVNNTFVGNVGTGGAPCTGAAILVCTESLEVFVERNIFAGSEGCAVACRFGAEGTTVRDNIFWNNLPRDVDNPRSCFPFSPAENFFVNPLFCDPAHDDYRVRSDSPALAGPNVIGAYPEPGCEP